MSFFPKYVEFNDDHVVAFDPTFHHSQIVEWVVINRPVKPVSAGSMIFMAERQRYFGNSTSLNLWANANLDTSRRDWYGGVQKPSEYLMFTTCPELSVAFGLSGGNKKLPFLWVGEEYRMPDLFYPPKDRESMKSKLERFNGG